MYFLTECSYLRSMHDEHNALSLYTLRSHPVVQDFRATQAEESDIPFNHSRFASIRDHAGQRMPPPYVLRRERQPHSLRGTGLHCLMPEYAMHCADDYEQAKMLLRSSTVFALPCIGKTLLPVQPPRFHPTPALNIKSNTMSVNEGELTARSRAREQDLTEMTSGAFPGFQRTQISNHQAPLHSKDPPALVPSHHINPEPSCAVSAPKPSDAKCGIGMQLVTCPNGDIVVLSVRAGSQAECAQVTQGDRILAVDGTRVDGTNLNCQQVQPPEPHRALLTN